MAAKFLGTALSAVGLFAALKGTTSTSPTGKYGNFLSEFRKKSFARNNLFEVTLFPPKVITGEKLVYNLHLYAESASIPGLNFATSDIRRYGYGPIEKKPYAPIFNDITISFLVDGTGDLYKFFNKWMNRIVSSDQYVNGSSSNNGLSAFEVEYKDDYKTQINISTFDEAGEVVLNTQLVDAVPIAISDTQLSWSDNDSVMKLQVTFTYFQHILLDPNSREPSSGVVKPLSGLQQLIKAGTALQTLSSLRKPRSIGDVINVVNNAKVIAGGFGF